MATHPIPGFLPLLSYTSTIWQPEQQDGLNHDLNSPECLLTEPPAAISGYVHLAGLHTGRLCASVPADMSQKAECETVLSICVAIGDHTTSSTFMFPFVCIVGTFI